MWVNWKRFSLGAFLLASLSLLLFGCGDYSGSQTAQKSISGVVSGSDGVALADARVTAYAVDANGVQSGVPLSSPQSVLSDNKGRYRLSIPASYNGSVMVVATNASVGKAIAKLLHLGSGSVTYRSAVPGSQVAKGAIPPVMISFATETVAQYIVNNYTVNSQTAFTAQNIQAASLILEKIFGFNFTQTAPPASATDTNTSKAQQDLLVSIQGVNKYVQGDNSVYVGILTALKVDNNGLIGAIGAIADGIKAGIYTAITELTADGLLTPEYVPSSEINTAISNLHFALVSAPDLADTTPPAAPAGLAVTGTTARSVTLTWNKLADTDVDGYLVYRIDPAGGRACIGAVPPLSLNPNDATHIAFTDFLAASSSNYQYFVAAYDVNHNISGPSSTVSATTLAATDNIVPTAPAGLVVKGFNATQVNLQWIGSTKTNNDGSIVPAAGYNVYRDGQFLAFTTQTYFVDATAAPSTNYTYFVKATDENQNQSIASASVAVHTLAVEAGPPLPGAVTVVNTETRNELTWSYGDATATFNVYRDGILIAAGILPVSGTGKYNDDSVVPNTSYVYDVTAVVGGKESAGSRYIYTAPIISTGAPTVPANVTAISVASNSVALAWVASTNPGGDVAGYDVWRYDVNGNNPFKVGTVAEPSFVDSNGVVESTGYIYRIRSFNSLGARSAESDAVAVTTPAKIDLSDTTAPNAPSGLAAPTVTDYSVNLTWSASSSSDTAGYLVYRNGAQVADVHALLGFVDTTVAAGTTYVYTVYAYDNSGNLSAASGAVTVTTAATIPDNYTISGRVTVNGVGLAGVNLNSGSLTAVTDVNGYYTFSALPAGTYTITPVATSFIQFAPVTRTATITGNLSAQDFAATITGAVSSGVSYPTGTIVGGISFPAGTIIGGIVYPSGTIIGGVFYPTGTVVGGVTYPGGVVIGGVTYPAGTVVGGVAFPVGAVTTGVGFPTGGVTGSVVYPSGVVATSSMTWETGYLISGKVADLSSVGIPGATVFIGDWYTTTTDSGGNYKLYVPVGTYTVSASHAGHSFADSAPVTLDTNNTTRTVNFTSSI